MINNLLSNFFSEDATYFELFGVKEGAAKAGEDTRRKQSPKRTRPRGPPPAPVAKHEYPNWEDAFSHRDFAFESESEGAKGGGDSRRRSRSRSPSPIKRAEKKQPSSKIDQYADAFDEFERGK